MRCPLLSPPLPALAFPAAPREHAPPSSARCRSGVQMVRDVMERAAAAGLNTIRTFAHTTDPAYPLQV